MAFTSNLKPTYSLGPMAAKVVLPAAAKTVLTDTSNAAKLVSAMNDNRQLFGMVFAQPAATLVAGKLMLFLVSGASAFDIDEIAHAAMTVNTTTRADMIQFSRWSNNSPLIIPEGHELWIATAVAQTAGALVGHAQSGKVF